MTNSSFRPSSLATAFALILVAACGSTTPMSVTPEPEVTFQQVLYDPAFRKLPIIIKAGFIHDAENKFLPHTELLEGKNPWGVYYLDNLKALFPGRDIRVPLSLEEMTDLGNSLDNYDIKTIAELAGRMPNKIDSTPVLNIVFLDKRFAAEPGYHHEKAFGYASSQPPEHPYVTISMAVINNIPDPVMQNFVQLSTLIHETGHIFGLVENGIHQVITHEDPNHPAHCINPACIMYWSDEGTSTNINIWRMMMTAMRGDVVFDSACRADIAAFIQNGIPTR